MCYRACVYNFLNINNNMLLVGDNSLIFLR